MDGGQSGSFSAGLLHFRSKIESCGRGIGVRKVSPVSAYLPEMAQSDRRNNLFTFVGATFRSIVCLSMYLGLRLWAAGPFELSVCIEGHP